MKYGSFSESPEAYSEPQVQRRRILQTAAAVTMGGGLQSLASADTIAEEWSAGPLASVDGASNLPTGGGVDSPLQNAIKACLDCHSICLQTANFCLERGGRHVEQQHFRLMLNCAEICQTSANFMLSGSPLHGLVCGVCAEVCEACAKSCEEVGGMRECVEECQRCAKSCRTMV